MTTDSVLHSFAYGLDFLRDQVADVSAADMVAQPTGIPNHPAWTVGHLAFACELLGGALGLSPWLPTDWADRYGSGSVPVPEVSRYETKERALAVLQDGQFHLTRGVQALGESQLNAPFPDEAYRDVFPTLRHALTQVLVGHTSFHVGQLSVWRRAMKLQPITRAFE